MAGLPLMASDSDDPGGWTKAKWGMTYAQLHAALPDAVRWKDPKGLTHIGLRNYVIDDIWFCVEFFYKIGEELNAVVITPERDADANFPNEKRRDIGIAVLMGHADWVLGTSLFTKYGKPDSIYAPSDEDSRVSKWLFPRTEIRLTYTDDKKYYIGSDSTLFYLKRVKSDQL